MPSKPVCISRGVSNSRVVQKMEAGAELVNLEDLYLNRTMTREGMIELLDQKYGNRRNGLPPQLYECHIQFVKEFVEEALYRLMEDGEAFDIGMVVLCLDLWTLIETYHTEDEEEKQSIRNWMASKVTSKSLNRSRAAQGA